MRILKNPLEKGKVEMGLILELAFKSLLLLTEIVAGAAFDIDEDSRKADSLKIRPVFPIKRLAARADKSSDS
jgi:hypothetical protein